VSWTYTGSELLSISIHQGVGHYEQSLLSMFEKYYTDEQELYRVYAQSSLLRATDPVIISRLDSGISSLVTAFQTEQLYINGPSAEADFLYYALGETDPCLFKTCTNQYWSHKSASSTSGQLWGNIADPPCCGDCTVYANGVQLFYWPTPNPVPSVTAYAIGNFTL
jgi:hypothetical protein